MEQQNGACENKVDQILQIDDTSSLWVSCVHFSKVILLPKSQPCTFTCKNKSLPYPTISISTQMRLRIWSPNISQEKPPKCATLTQHDWTLVLPDLSFLIYYKTVLKADTVNLLLKGFFKQY